MAKGNASPSSKKKKKKKPTNRKQTLITVLIFLALISFVLPDILPLFMSSSGNRNTSTRTELPKNPSTPPPPAPVFKKEGEATILGGETGEAIKTIDIEIADDPAQRQQGLMFRKSMRDEEGMLFLFDRPAPQSFWMKNTYIPLDILYLDENRKITTIHPSTTPLSEVGMPSDGNAQYVLEVNGGWCQRYGVKVGDIVEW